MRLEIPEDKKLVYQTTFGVKWGDMDAMGQLVIVGVELDLVKFKYVNYFI